MTWLPSLAIAGIVAAAARGMRWLTSGGALAAVLVGFATLWGGGLPAGALLATFFVTSSLLTDSKALGQGLRVGRTAWQVVANGGWAAGAAVSIPYSGHVGWGAAAGALAAAQADTWATEIGRRSATPPRLITTGQVVMPGTSGGVTPMGTWGGVAGGSVLGAVGIATGSPWLLATVAVGAGLVAATVDSLLGATVQARWRCVGCGASGERLPLSCGHDDAACVAGSAWCSNDAVNLIATGIGAALGALGATWAGG